MQAARHPAGNRVEESRKGGFRNRPGSTTNWINEAEQPTHLLHLLPGGEEEVDEVWDDVKSNAPQDQLMAEVVQVAAMCVRYAETLDRFREPE